MGCELLVAGCGLSPQGILRNRSPMANINDFRDFDAFKACRAFAREIGFLVRSTPLRRNRNLADQMERASISILSNFAEGAERDGNTEFIQFLSISKGSIGELRAQLIYSLDTELIDQIKYDTLDTMATSAGKLVGGLVRYLKTSGRPGRKFENRTRPIRKKKQARARKAQPATRN
jgi:four helix bundle protein